MVFTSRRLSSSASVLIFPILVSSTLADGLSPRASGPGRDAYGATVRLFLGERSLTGVVNPAIGYASSSDPRVHFGLGDADRVERIEVACPCGGRQTFPGGGVDRFVELELTECRP